jgi:GH43 family beta-xylosidase
MKLKTNFKTMNTSPGKISAAQPQRLQISPAETRFAGLNPPGAAELGKSFPGAWVFSAVIFLFFLTTAVGEAAAVEFQNPINSGPDPYLDFYAGNYYLTTTQGDCIRMWKSKTLGGLKTATPVVVWRDAESSRSRGIWAPEFHFITNHWYMYYTAMASNNDDESHRMHVLESAGTDPLGPYVYKGRLVNPANDHYAIDGSVFKNPGDGLWYFIWAAHPGHVVTIAQMANPWTLRGKGVVIPAAGFGCSEVREGPIVLQSGGKLFLVYSACDTGKPDYMLGMLQASTNSDLMNPASWRQYPQPVFTRNDDAGVFGPGHNGFFKAADGTDWIVYHAKTTAQYTYRGRTTRVQPFTWNADGTPNFGKPLPLSAVLDEPVNSGRENSPADK